MVLLANPALAHLSGRSSAPELCDDPRYPVPTTDGRRCGSSDHTYRTELGAHFVASLDFNGTLVMTLEHWDPFAQDRTPWVLTCDLNQTRSDCQTEGDPPLPGVPFRKRCTSHAYQDPSGNATGWWSCELDHD